MCIHFFWGKLLQAKTLKTEPKSQIGYKNNQRIKVCCDHDINSPPKKKLLQLFFCASFSSLRSSRADRQRISQRDLTHSNKKKQQKNRHTYEHSRHLAKEKK